MSIEEERYKLFDRFVYCKNKISSDTIFSSNPNDRCNHPLYKEVESMGWTVLPLIILDLQMVRWHFWAKALKLITGHTPSYSKIGNVNSICDYWVNWSKNNINTNLDDFFAGKPIKL